MADQSVTDGTLTDKTAPILADKLLVVDSETNPDSLKEMELTYLLKIINLLTADSSPDRSADYIATYDASAASPKKALLSDAGGFPLFCHIGQPAGGAAPADATTYYFTTTGILLPTSAANNKIRIPRAGVVRAVYIDGICVAGSAETSTISFRLNDTTDTTITSSAIFSASPFTFSNTTLSITVAAGDYFTLKWVTPTWVTNPTTLTMWALIWIA